VRKELFNPRLTTKLGRVRALSIFQKNAASLRRGRCLGLVLFEESKTHDSEGVKRGARFVLGVKRKKKKGGIDG